jgi:hypothetical protein
MALEIVPYLPENPCVLRRLNGTTHDGERANFSTIIGRKKCEERSLSCGDGFPLAHRSIGTPSRRGYDRLKVTRETMGGPEVLQNGILDAKLGFVLQSRGIA